MGAELPQSRVEALVRFAKALVGFAKALVGFCKKLDKFSIFLVRLVKAFFQSLA